MVEVTKEIAKRVQTELRNRIIEYDELVNKNGLTEKRVGQG